MVELGFEPVLRKKSPYLRRKSPRDFDSSSEYRKEAMIAFADSVIEKRGKPYEEVIDNVRIRMKEKPTRRSIKKRIIELTPENLREIQLQMVRCGVDKLVLPDGYELKIKEEIPIDEIVRLLE